MYVLDEYERVANARNEERRQPFALQARGWRGRSLRTGPCLATAADSVLVSTTPVESRATPKLSQWPSS